MAKLLQPFCREHDKTHAKYSGALVDPDTESIWIAHELGHWAMVLTSPEYNVVTFPDIAGGSYRVFDLRVLAQAWVSTGAFTWEKGSAQGCYSLRDVAHNYHNAKEGLPFTLSSEVMAPFMALSKLGSPDWKFWATRLVSSSSTGPIVVTAALNWVEDGKRYRRSAILFLGTKGGASYSSKQMGIAGWS